MVVLHVKCMYDDVIQMASVYVHHRKQDTVVNA